MSLEEILCQISTFIAAGHETTSSALTWCLYALSQSPHSQNRLRAELLSLPAPSHQDQMTLADKVQQLPYLDWVVRETLRVHSPITTTMRVVGKVCDEIPVRTPFLDGMGRWKRSVSVKKHDVISIPLQAINKNEEIWGEDAAVFR
jgi:hypothetical protein